MVRNQRGNVILTAIFVSVFLFFLSVALLYANRQDIALSLSIEHRLKSETEARSLAFEAYGQLREFGELRRNLPTNTNPDDGVTSRVQLVRLPALEDRGEVLLVRVRATSGPVNSYLTLHLLETKMTDSANSNVILFPNEDSGGAVYGNFVWSKLNADLSGTLSANGGPVFRTEPSSIPDQPYFKSQIPVFVQENMTLKAFGPALAILPKPTDSTELSWLNYTNSDFYWETIPHPGNLGGDEPEVNESTTTLPVQAPSGDWTDLCLQGVAPELFTFLWTDPKPSTSSMGELATPPIGHGGYEASPLSEWSGGADETQEWFVTRGASAASQETLFTHAWHYLYRPYPGGYPDPVTPLDGARLTRWPCILKYETSSGLWSKAWTPLNENGNVSTEHRPDPSMLLATSNGTLYSFAESTRQLLKMTGPDQAELGDLVPEGQVFLYRNAPHLISSENPRAILNLIDETSIGFSSLPDRIPSVAGPLADFPEGEIIAIDEAGTNDITVDGALELPPITPQVILPEQLLNYSISAGSKPAVDGNDLWIQVDIGITQVESLYPLWNKEWLEKNSPRGGTALARYDGQRWHILPNGLRVFLERSRLDPQVDAPPDTETPPANSLAPPPGASNLVVASYSGLPDPIPRYTIISIDRDPFKFNDE